MIIFLLNNKPYLVYLDPKIKQGHEKTLFWVLRVSMENLTSFYTHLYLGCYQCL